MSYLTLIEAAEKLEIGYKKIRQLAKGGAFNGVKKVQGSWQIPKSQTITRYR